VVYGIMAIRMNQVRPQSLEKSLIGLFLIHLFFAAYYGRKIR